MIDPITKSEKILGKGSFGTVTLMADTKNNNSLVAVKISRRVTESEARLALEEAKLLRTLSHPNIITCIDAFSLGGEICVVLEYCPLGDLDRYIASLRDRGMTLSHLARSSSLYQNLIYFSPKETE